MLNFIILLYIYLKIVAIKLIRSLLGEGVFNFTKE